MERMTAPCSNCLGETHQNVLHQVVQTLDDGVSHEVYRLLECAGCHNISMAHLSFYDGVVRECYKKRYYPSRTMRKLPSWRSKLPFGAQLFEEIYEAVGGAQYRLALMGIRALLEQVMISNVGDHGTFERNLNTLCEQGYISIKQRDAMNDVLEAGHATTHRQFSPTEAASGRMDRNWRIVSVPLSPASPPTPAIRAPPGKSRTSSAFKPRRCRSNRPCLERR